MTTPKNNNLAILQLIVAVLTLNPADTPGVQGAQQKARELKDDMSPEENAKFDEAMDALVTLRNSSLPGRGFDSFISGYTAPVTAPAKEPEPAAETPKADEPAPVKSETTTSPS